MGSTWVDTEDPTNNARVCINMQLVCDADTELPPGVPMCSLACLEGGAPGRPAQWLYQVKHIINDLI